jgi:hypothetical protein
MERQKLIKRLRTLRNLELFNIFFLPACLYLVLSTREILHQQPYIVSMFNICVILAQGVLYWHLKLLSICSKEAALPMYAYRVFSFFKKANILLFIVYPLLFILGKTTQVIDFKISIWSNLLYLFGIMEYVNYYQYQLSHDNLVDIRYLIKHKKFRRAPLWTDLQHKNK